MTASSLEAAERRKAWGFVLPALGWTLAFFVVPFGFMAAMSLWSLQGGQIVGGLLMSHFGWLGSPVDKITVSKLAGVALMIAGVVLATFRK